MHKFTTEQIEGTRNHFRSAGYREVEITLGNRTYSYFVLPQSLEPILPDFVFRCTGDSTDNYVLGISDGVKEPFRPYAVVHELIEFTEIGIDEQGRCRRALEREIELVPTEIRQKYLRMR